MKSQRKWDFHWKKHYIGLLAEDRAINRFRIVKEHSYFFKRNNEVQSTKQTQTLRMLHMLDKYI